MITVQPSRNNSLQIRACLKVAGSFKATFGPISDLSSSFLNMNIQENRSSLQDFVKWNLAAVAVKSVHFKKTVARISILSKLWYFLF